MLEIQVGRLVAFVDEADELLIQRFHWNTFTTAGLTYARAHSHMDEGKQVYAMMHNIIMDDLWIDHIDGNGLNNTKANLRKATNAENQANSRKRTGTHSQYKGVTWNKRNNRWQGYINKAGVRYYLGCFLSEEEAAKAYDAKAFELFGTFARRNLGGE